MSVIGKRPKRKNNRIASKNRKKSLSKWWKGRNRSWKSSTSMQTRFWSSGMNIANVARMCVSSISQPSTKSPWSAPGPTSSLSNPYTSGCGVNTASFTSIPAIRSCVIFQVRGLKPCTSSRWRDSMRSTRSTPNLSRIGFNIVTPTASCSPRG